MRKFMARLLGWDSAPRLLTFRYMYLRHPFDDAQYFSVQAANQAVADKLAIECFNNMFNNHQTVTVEFWRA